MFNRSCSVAIAHNGFGLAVGRYLENKRGQTDAADSSTMMSICTRPPTAAKPFVVRRSYSFKNDFMRRSKQQLSLDITTGEDIYFGKPENRRFPEIGDECWVLVDGELCKSVVKHKTKCYFYAEVVEGKNKGMETLPPGIPNERFRPVEF